MKKLDIMNKRDEVGVGEVCNWQLVGGKPTKVEVKTKPIVEEEIRVIGPVVKEAIKEVEEVPMKKVVKEKGSFPSTEKAKKEVKGKWTK